ncbi:MAG: L-seryl-tRNA(Sec) selenium transferase [Candidatus Latescibacteria bacterium]|nr:L-seryl-tRNA(Sec) selenium transferase [Candidatus Latescibacterota bacterium]NIM21111.1 L-seryl-tRNA(Sec) selenium transferase [Candidatus Latescibacterota bacterium]NIM65246.1 L-seryl-tRNA(Sec) selenium transferase [Candidatus Latescibacterota bacterium]NIO01761.1 L-seryl-tRNA(Sec) selenium transferase [Candidatus Latescibacterota bacterium]NIO28278.1 L-seryl-tRNA(Sec) selenium transferase [Candidatus Latescibacterota bacterium]
MAKARNENILRAIPSVDSLLAEPPIAELRQRHPRFPWTQFIRLIVDDFRAACERGGKDGTGDRETVKERLVQNTLERLERLRSGGQQRVINATGVILHTNLGRAVLGQRVREAVVTALSSYVNLEYDLPTGERGSRGETMLELACLASGAEAAMVVNNNAAAVYLVVNTYSPPGRIIVSRGELVEIGGSFRLPDILSRAAGEVVEVGTTNRTYAKDYERVAKPGDVILKVHRSNYELSGFVHEASIAELVEVGRKKECHVVFDLGSGAFHDFAEAGIGGEEVVSVALDAGVDCVTMSGDKLLGGVQAGIILGRAIFLARLKQNPLRRAIRVDKLCIAALEALFRCYLFEDRPEAEVTLLDQVLGPVEALRSRAENVIEGLRGQQAAGLTLEIVDDEAAVGGGSFATEKLPSAAISIRCTSEREAVGLAKKMRTHELPIVPRIKGSEVRINMRSVLPDEDEDLKTNLGMILGRRS